MVGGERSQRSLSLSLTDVNMDLGLKRLGRNATKVSLRVHFKEIIEKRRNVFKWYLVGVT